MVLVQLQRLLGPAKGPARLLQAEGQGRTPHRVAAAGLSSEDTRTSVGDAVLALGAQLRQEHVLGWLLRRVVEENLEEKPSP